MTLSLYQDFPGGSVVNNLPVNAEDSGSIPGSGKPLEKEMTTQSIILTWKITWTEEPGGLQSIGSDYSPKSQTKWLRD